MATMIPDIDPAIIENDGERLVYLAALTLPADYTVLYSYKFTVGDNFGSPGIVYESDFIIIHPALGYLVLEVKSGDYMYSGNQWLNYRGKGYVPAEKDPVEQAKRAMYKILDNFKSTARKGRFPLKICYGVFFPHASKISGSLPQELRNDSVFLSGDLDNLEEKVVKVFGGKAKSCCEDTDLLIKQVLAPTFKLYDDLESQMEQFAKRSQKILTAEQERIIEETSLDNRKVFLGGAGTGKTFIAMEKTKKLIADGKKVLLTCFNRNLGNYFKEMLSDEISSGLLRTTNFHDFMAVSLEENKVTVKIPDTSVARSEFFSIELPEMAFDLFTGLPDEEKYDALVVDEGQDFREDWFPVLESFLREGENGEFYIFADLYQSLFNPDHKFVMKLPISKHRLMRNLRNTSYINEWLNKLLPEGAQLVSPDLKGIPVVFSEWESEAEECRQVEKEIGRLVSQGIQPCRIFILSPNIKEKSCFAGRDKIKDWPLGEYDDNRQNAVRFCTIRSFKGLESEVVFLTGIRKDNRACTNADIYVASSRARFLLHVFHEKGFFSFL